MPTLSDQEFIQQFEALTLDPVHLNHQGHLRLAWLYLQKDHLGRAIELTCSGIKAYAESLGATDKFHYTITDGLVRVIWQRMQDVQSTDWRAFLESNQDLQKDALQVLYQYYSEHVLFSEAAKTSWVLPDLKRI